MAGKIAHILGKKRCHVARLRIDLARASPLEGSPFHARLATRLTLRTVPLHGATKQISRQGKCGRAHPERTGYSLVHQLGERRVETALERNPQQNHGGIRIQILLPGLMLRVRLPGIEKPDEIWPRVFASMPPVVFVRSVWQSRSVTRKLSKSYPTNVTATL